MDPKNRKKPDPKDLDHWMDMAEGSVASANDLTGIVPAKLEDEDEAISLEEMYYGKKHR